MNFKLNKDKKNILIDRLNYELSYKHDRLNIILYSSIALFGFLQFLLRFFYKTVAYLFLAISIFGILKLKEIKKAHQLTKNQINALENDDYLLVQAIFLGAETDLIEEGFELDNENILFANDLNRANSFKKTALFKLENQILYCNLDEKNFNALIINESYDFLKFTYNTDYIFVPL